VRRSRVKLPPEAYKELCFTVFSRDGWKCRCCKRRSGLHCHHIVFRSQGGDDSTENLITLCSTCHDSVHNVSKNKLQIVVLPIELGQPLDANGKLRFYKIGGWNDK